MPTTQELHTEIERILDYWYKQVLFAEENRFFGRVDENNDPEPGAPMGSVMYARILWSCSAAYPVIRDQKYLDMAAVAYRWLTGPFSDDIYEGIYWTIGIDGNQILDKKQTYAQAFTLYALAEYYKVIQDKNVLNRAISFYQLIEARSFDQVSGGYFEAYARDWSDLPDVRLSAKDLNHQKTMNTNLHVMEAYTNLYRIWPDAQLAQRIGSLLNLFGKYIINASDKHLGLFFDKNWRPVSRIISYGHDIEASWLLCEAAEVLGKPGEIYHVSKLAIDVVQAAMEGFDDLGGLDYEYEPQPDNAITEKHWWVQAEAIVGLLNAWQLTGEAYYYTLFEKSWNYIKHNLIDHQNGEWFWGVDGDGRVMVGQDKAGIWKCPYHNTRCLLQMLERLSHTQSHKAGRTALSYYKRIK